MGPCLRRGDGVEIFHPLFPYFGGSHAAAVCARGGLGRFWGRGRLPIPVIPAEVGIHVCGLLRCHLG